MIKRQAIEFMSHNLKCAGWFFKATGRDKAPCIILAHGFGGVKELRLDAYALRFAEAGYHALVFDYRHFGESGGEPRQLLSIKRQQQDWHSAIRYSKGLEGVDPQRIVLWGTSFSGGHVLSVAAGGDPDIAAVISQVPHMNGIATSLATGPVQNVRLGFAAMRDIARMITFRKPYFVPIIGHPGETAAMTAPGEKEAMERLRPEGFKLNEQVAARIFLSIPFFSPGRLAPRLKIPWLVQAAVHDRTTPLKPVMRAALKAPKGKLIVYRCGHFDAYVEPFFEQTVSDQIAFLAQVLR